MKFFSIFVGLVALFIGLFIYKIYLPLSPKLSGDSTIAVVGHNAVQYVGLLGEQLGLGSQVKIVRAAFDIIDRFILTRNFEMQSIVEDANISGVSVRIFRPRNEEKQHLPGFIYFHGGGLALFTAKTGCFQNVCSKLSNATKSIVISVSYRLAPEHIFPAQFVDCYSVVSAVINDPGKFGIIKGKVVIGGDSSGGLLAAAISVELTKEGKSKDIAAQLLIYPWLQLIDIIYLPSYKEYSEGFLLSQEVISYFSSLSTTGKTDVQQAYLSGNVSRYFMCTPYWKFFEIPKSVDCDMTTESLPPEFVRAVTDPRLSPLLAESVEGLPPTFIAMAEYDILASEGDVFASRLKRSGVPVVHKRYKSYHGFLVNIGQPHQETDMLKKAVNDIVDYLNFVFYNK